MILSHTDEDTILEEGPTALPGGVVDEGESRLDLGLFSSEKEKSRSSGILRFVNENLNTE